MSVSHDVDDDEWVVDSGAGCHMSNSAQQMLDITSSCITVKTASGEELQVKGEGTLLKKVSNGSIVLKRVLIVPELTRNLISVSSLCADGYQVEFNDKCLFKKDHETLVSIKQSNNGLFILDNKTNSGIESFNVDADIIHCRLGHAGANVLRKHNLSISGKNCEASN